MGAVTLTITARDPAHARKILEAVEQVDAGATVDELLVTPTGEAPTGHTYRELCDAHRSGLLEAAKTSKGIVLTREALDAYRKTKSERRRKPRAPAAVTDLTEHRIRALESAGIKVR